jgi:BirA family biotin operon repressor/biotin-[acetyl-CoA-carboxylase] ligase
MADGRFHSGVALGNALGVSRAKVWLLFKELDSLGLSVESVKGRGYRMAKVLELLDLDKVMGGLTPTTRSRLGEIELFLSLDSTNSYLMQRARRGASSGSVCFSEHQSAGRGRRGRNWVSPLASNLYMSVLWRFTDGLTRLSGLSLAVAIAVVDAFESLDILGLSIKWPNDIVSDAGKIGGILLEVAGETNGPCYAVIGFGVNIDMPRLASSSIDQPWANIPRGDGLLLRNEIAASLLNQIFRVLVSYEKEGLVPFLSRWHQHDFVRDKAVNIETPNGVVAGIARGIDEHGGLLIEQQSGQLTRYSSGEVSLRVSKAG